MNDFEKYAASVEREAAQKMREREAFRDASRLWYQLMDGDGFTFRPDRSSMGMPPCGYMVSLPEYTLIVRTCTVETIYRYLLEHWDKFSWDSTYYIGAWEHNGYVHLDVSEHFTSGMAAIEIGKQRNQKAIWDIINDREIILRGNHVSGTRLQHSNRKRRTGESKVR